MFNLYAALRKFCAHSATKHLWSAVNLAHMLLLKPSSGENKNHYVISFHFLFLLISYSNMCLLCKLNFSPSHFSLRLLVNNTTQMTYFAVNRGQEKQPHCIPRGYPFQHNGNVVKRGTFILNSNFTIEENIFNKQVVQENGYHPGTMFTFKIKIKRSSKALNKL